MPGKREKVGLLMAESIGKLRFRLALLKQVDKAGGQTSAAIVKEYQTVATVWGDIRDFKGAHVFNEKNTDEALTDVVVIRHNAAFNNRSKITHVFNATEDIVYEIQEIRLIRHRKRFLKLKCVHRGESSSFNIIP